MLARVYLLVQAVAFAAWWLVLGVAPTARASFQVDDAPFSSLLAFLPADLVVVALTFPVVTASHRGRRWAGYGAWAIAGAVGYAALFCLTQLALTGSGVAAAVAMTPAAILSAWSAGAVVREAT